MGSETEAKIKKAYIELYTVQNKIAVSDLCKKAEISRNTFYEHYAKLESLHDEILSDLFAELTSSVNSMIGELNLHQYLEWGLEFIRKHRDVFYAFSVVHMDGQFITTWKKSLEIDIRKIIPNNIPDICMDMMAFSIIGGLRYIVQYNLFDDCGPMIKKAEAFLTEN